MKYSWLVAAMFVSVGCASDMIRGGQREVTFYSPATSSQPSSPVAVYKWEGNDVTAAGVSLKAPNGYEFRMTKVSDNGDVVANAQGQAVVAQTQMVDHTITALANALLRSNAQPGNYQWSPVTGTTTPPDNSDILSRTDWTDAQKLAAIQARAGLVETKAVRKTSPVTTAPATP